MSTLASGCRAHLRLSSGRIQKPPKSAEVGGHGDQNNPPDGLFKIVSALRQ
jgi:hypothetical protein